MSLARKEDPFYKTTKWAQTRRSILVRDKYMCQCCLANNIMTNADCVHHIFPRERYEQYQYDSWNLMSLCSKCHNEMHNHYTGELSEKGMLFLRAIAQVKGIEIETKEQTILVVGLRGSGKTTYVRQQLDEYSIAYDLDYLAAAFRLKRPDEEYFKPARRMANDFLKGFIAKAHDYAKLVYIIRTAPSEKELDSINPDLVVFCNKQYQSLPMDDRPKAERDLKALKQMCLARSLKILERN